MSGHSKWATIKRKKGKTDAARGKLFNKFIREITVAARMGGGDLIANARLRLAVDRAKASNMPSKNIENAIAKGSGKAEGVSYEENVYEGYAPGGVALLIQVLTDNNNRTVAEIRHLVSKSGGSLGEANCVSWMFKAKGLIAVEKTLGEDEMMELVLDIGAEDMTSEKDAYEITTTVENFEKVKTALTQKGLKVTEANLTKVPDNLVKVEGDVAQKVLRLLEALEDHDDVQNVYANLDIDEKTMEQE